MIIAIVRRFRLKYSRVLKVKQKVPDKGSPLKRLKRLGVGKWYELG